MASVPFAIAEAVLGDMYRVTEGHRVALRGRMKHFQRMSFPAGANPGKGRAAILSFDELAQLTFAFELVQAGLSPIPARDITAGSWLRVRDAVAAAMRPGPDGDLWAILHPEALRELTGRPHHFLDYYDDVIICQASGLATALTATEEPVVGEHWRSIVIAVRPVIGHLVDALTRHMPDLDVGELVADLDRAAEAAATGDDE